MREETETTCFDYMDECRISGREEDIMKQYYLEHGVSEEMIDNATNFLNNFKSQSNKDDCNLITCRYNQGGQCTNEDKRKECVEVGRKVLCLEDERK